jgi:hypothetical protein
MKWHEWPTPSPSKRSPPHRKQVLRIEKREGGEGVRVWIDSALTWAAVPRGLRPDVFTIADPPPALPRQESKR